MYTAKNHSDGPDKTVIGGELVIEAAGKITVEEGASVEGLTATASAASATALGGIKAATKGAGDTVECKIDGTSSKLYVPAYPTLPVAATTETAGLVKVSANVAVAAGDAPTKAEYDALIGALITAGIMASAE